MMLHAASAQPPSQRDAPAPTGAAAQRSMWAMPAPNSTVLLGGMIALFIGTFVWLTWLTHARLGTFGFDLGIFDQGVWLLSRFQDPFLTIRGLPLFGDHGSYILLLVAPLYWIWADPRLLLLLQAVCLAIPAVSVYLIGTRRLGSPLAGLAVAAAYLAFPALQWAAVWHFHPETLAAAFLGLAALAADRQRWRQMAVWLGLALLCKEDVGWWSPAWARCCGLPGTVRSAAAPWPPGWDGFCWPRWSSSRWRTDAPARIWSSTTASPARACPPCCRQSPSWPRTSGTTSPTATATPTCCSSSPRSWGCRWLIRDGCSRWPRRSC